MIIQSKLLIWITLTAAWFPSLSSAACVIRNSDRSISARKADALYLLLTQAPSCPTRAQDLKALLLSAGAKVQPSMVANRGRNNPERGSFSLFESVSGRLDSLKLEIAAGEFFFGHFTAADVSHRIILDQKPETGKLLIELIAWDPRKGLFNFYELIGQQSSAQWFYRGDSEDILRDNAYVQRDVPPGQSKFGKTLRCSACHSSGGPIMKELTYPHNDWWTNTRPLPFGSNSPSSELNTWLADLIDANRFAENVKRGIHKLDASPAYRSAKAARSLQEQLRPLFCENEINLESSQTPAAQEVKIPSAFFMNPILAQVSVAVRENVYARWLKDTSMSFPETALADADHPWLSPVKGHSDLLAIQSLMSEAVVDRKFAFAVLSVDILNPIFSQDRCSLLKLVPLIGPKWREAFLLNLKASPLPRARELADLLESLASAEDILAKARDLAAHLESARPKFSIFKKLIQMRKAVFESEISQNPRGQIMEPGFRVIFPVPGQEASPPP